MTTNGQGLLQMGGTQNGDPSNLNPNPTNDPNHPTGGTGSGTNSDPTGSGDPGKGSGEDFKTNWKDFIPEDLKDRSEWNNIKDVSDLYKNYINAQQTISKSVRLPDATSTPEDVAAFYSKLGKPQDKTDYKFEYKPAKENYVYNQDSFDFSVFQDIADKANLTADQYKALASAYLDINNENYINYNKSLADKAAQELKDAEGKLKAAWGQQYNSNINAITEKVKKLYPESTLTRMQNAGLFRDPEFLEAHLKLTKMMTGDTVFIEGNAVENVPQTLQTLQEKRDKLMGEDYTKNREQVLALNKQIVQLKQSQNAGAAKFHG
jgi:hypothetical protein